ncbi:hypothetical protein BDN72DRAFT_964289 [Pluteus cervinus]|uniref:Uncharacterized protein n=1 Tax=Pluteus cervinus TaxID=181527 RepID=A0ACD3ADE4_9AGAR|nr:hypothetical protein BDN72DRAFT_964289 [Pluteus cervinus]
MPAERRSGKSKRIGRLRSLPHRPKHPSNANTNHRHGLQSQFSTSTTGSVTPLQSMFEAVPELALCIGEGFPEGRQSELDAIQHSIGIDTPLTDVFLGLPESDEGYNELRDAVAPTYVHWLRTVEPLPARDTTPVPQISLRKSDPSPTSKGALLSPPNPTSSTPQLPRLEV